MQTVLILGGTTEAYQLAEAIDVAGRWRAITSLAGRTAAPRIPAGGLRVGGFGGAVGLAVFLREQRVAALIDATHPFASLMPYSAAGAAAHVAVPRLRLLRAPWVEQPGDRWLHVAQLDAAAEAIAQLGAQHVLLTTGRKELAPFARPELARVHFVVRSVDPPDPLPLAHATVITDRGPFRLDDELALLDRYRIDLLVTKNSGGAAAAPKLEAARARAIPVVMMARPPQPEGPTVATVDDALAWLDTVG